MSSLSVGNVHVSVAADAVIGPHVTVCVPFVAVQVTSAPTITLDAATVGSATNVRLSELEIPVSEPASRSTVGVRSMVKVDALAFDGGPDMPP